MHQVNKRKLRAQYLCGFDDILFEGNKLYIGGGGGGSPQATTTTNINYTPDELADRAKVRAEAERIYNNRNGSPEFPGAGVAGFTDPSISAQNYIMSQATGPLRQMADNVAGASTFGLRDILYGEDPTLQSAIDATVRPIYQSYTDPGGYFSQLRSEMVGNNTLGGSRDAIGQSILGGRFAQAAGDSAAKLAQQSRSDTLDTFNKALAFAPQNMNAMLQPGVALSAVGEQQQAQQQTELDYLTQQNLWDLNSPWQDLSNYASFIYGGQSPGTTTTSTSPQAKANPITGALGGAMAGAQVAGPWGALAGAVIGLLGSR